MNDIRYLKSFAETLSKRIIAVLRSFIDCRGNGEISSNIGEEAEAYQTYIEWLHSAMLASYSSRCTG